MSEKTQGTDHVNGVPDVGSTGAASGLSHKHLLAAALLCVLSVHDPE